MKQYKLLFQVQPSGLFGLPQDEMTVVAGKNTKGFTGPILDTRSGQFVSHGRLSDYRNEEDAVEFSGSLASFVLKVRDNFFWLRIASSDRRSALRTGVAAFEQFLRLLGVEQAMPFTFEVVQIEGEDGELEARPGVKPVELIRLTAFDIPALTVNIATAARLAVLDDERLTRSLLYHEHAGFLFQLRSTLGYSSTHFSFLLTSAYLTMWKGISTILGDPSKDSDYQSRYLQFGLARGYWQDRVRPLYDVRNTYDVAHYSLDPEAVKKVEESFGVASLVCREVIKAYAEHLASSGLPPNNALEPTAR